MFILLFPIRLRESDGGTVSLTFSHIFSSVSVFALINDLPATSSETVALNTLSLKGGTEAGSDWWMDSYNIKTGTWSSTHTKDGANGYQILAAPFTVTTTKQEILAAGSTSSAMLIIPGSYNIEISYDVNNPTTSTPLTYEYTGSTARYAAGSSYNLNLGLVSGLSPLGLGAPTVPAWPATATDDTPTLNKKAS